MTELGEINNRKIYYLKHNLEDAWFKNFPKGNWLLFAITDIHLPGLFNEISNFALDNNVVYVCSTGQEAESFHKAIDNVINIRGVEKGYLPIWNILTTAEKEVEEEFWFATFSAFGETQEIKKIICLDLTTSNYIGKLNDLIDKMKTGWIPNDKQLPTNKHQL